jgi:MoxR-like ATPase
MAEKAATSEAHSKETYLPPMFRVGDILAPKAPQDIASAGVEDTDLTDLALKMAYTVARFSSEWAAKKLHMSLPLIGAVMEQLGREGLVEETLRTAEGRSHYKITQRGRERAGRLLEICAYIGPAPVRLEAYAAMLRWQFAQTPEVLPAHVESALSSLVLPVETKQLAGLAVSSGRSLFVYGPAGNGKSSIGRQIHAALSGDYWIPHCISVANTVIKVYDDQVHEPVKVATDRPGNIDQRWVRIKRPLVIVGGELTLEFLDVIYSPTLRYYEAPPHLKANGGVFLVDDFGRERVSPQQLLNRFITPMEYQVDYFTLVTGQKIQVPLRHVLIIATNLDPATVTDPAFLRRMGYRLYLGTPTQEQYYEIFTRYAQRHGATIAPEVLDSLLARYRAQNRELRSCEPRDLIERGRDICRFHGKPLELTPQVLDLAWKGYFGSEEPGARTDAQAGTTTAEAIRGEAQPELAAR